jgi:ribonuclease HI
VHVDGGARGNPGPAAIAAVVSTPAGALLREVSEPIGEATNNVAEYRALLLGLDLAAELGAREVEVVGDSELVARQIGGQYRVKNATLKPLFEQAVESLRRFDRWSVSSVSRAENARADELVNEALDAQAGERPRGHPAAGEFRFVYRSERFDETVSFWRDGLGLQRAGGWDRGPGDRGEIYALGGGLVEVIDGSPGGPRATEPFKPSKGSFLLAEVDDVDAWFARAREHELLIVDEPRDEPWGDRSFGLADPNGLVVYLFSRSD